MRNTFINSKAIFFIVVLFYSGMVIAQQQYNLPTVIKPSPQSQAFTLYGDYPMSDYNGLTDITVPIHTITGKKLSLPVTMGFHASGRMANEVNGILGMRWTLNCGGLVTRVMKGAPDEWTAGRIVPYTAAPYHVPTYDELYNACPDGKAQGRGNNGSWYDTEFDIWSYVLPNGKQGHFILKDNNGVKVPMMIPYSPMQITFAKGNHSFDQYERIEITDVDGTKYIFGGDALTSNALETTPEYDAEQGLLGTVTTAWYMTKMVSSDGADEISLSYTTRDATSYTSFQKCTISDDIRDCSVLFVPEDCELDPYECDLMQFIIPYHFDQDQNSGDALTRMINSVVPDISGIQFTGGSVTFNYTTAPKYYPYDYSNKTILSEMVFNNESGQFKKVKFNMSLHIPEVDIDYLDNLSFYGTDNNEVKQKYDFSYYNSGAVASPLSQATIYKDWWGYATSASYVHNLLPFQNV